MLNACERKSEAGVHAGSVEPTFSKVVDDEYNRGKLKLDLLANESSRELVSFIKRQRNFVAKNSELQRLHESIVRSVPLSGLGGGAFDQIRAEEKRLLQDIASFESELNDFLGAWIIRSREINLEYFNDAAANSYAEKIDGSAFVSFRVEQYVGERAVGKFVEVLYGSPSVEQIAVISGKPIASFADGELFVGAIYEDGLFEFDQNGKNRRLRHYRTIIGKE